MSNVYEWKAFLRGWCCQHGLARRPRPDATARLLQRYRTDVVFDVGANNGQYARRLKAMGYRNRIVSFEPLTDAFQKLSANARAYPNWTIENIALGREDGEAELNVAGNSQSSSILKMTDLHRQAAPGSAYIGVELATLRRLDSIYDQFCEPRERSFLKLDVQGFEQDVLSGASGVLDRIGGIQLEMAATACYAGETLMPEMTRYLLDHGFALSSIHDGITDPRTGQLLQIEGIFYRESEFLRRRLAA